MVKSDAVVKFDFEKLDQLVAEHINDNAEKIAKQVGRDAMASINVKRGDLKKGIKARRSKFDDGGWIVISTAPHSWLVEHGHGGPKPAPPHAFLRPALDNNIQAARDLFGVR